jgi:hypothetical protein
MTNQGRFSAMARSGERIKALEGEPLSEATRKERRALMGFSGLAITIRLCDLIPEKISALGVEINGAQQSSLKWVLFALIAYFLVAFIIYGCQDWLVWRDRINEGLSADMKEYWEDNAVIAGKVVSPIEAYRPGKPLWKKSWKTLSWKNSIIYSYRIYQIRFGLELLVPVGIGVASLGYFGTLNISSAAFKSYLVCPFVPF